ncbi:hypothetical protein M404DRAFT_849557 [Pisolithus tinctorius Marx 270]|uniref:Uncharacterized protein n=1 Tax=Pisolithus tinctorius Marx 270 TaxID=870435 RepID=A0A0C3NBR4_PISTI|nr:hypothetical protein M404DRAFT_849557 [Pisolithus tinctorius Marx 270]
MLDKIIIASEPERPGHYGGPATFLPSSSAIASAFPPQAPGANAIPPDDQIILPEPVVHAFNAGIMFRTTNLQLHPHEPEVLPHPDNANHDSYMLANVLGPKVPLSQAPDGGPVNNVPDISDDETTDPSPDL